MKPIRVLLCDDQTVVREGLEAILSVVPHIEVVGAAEHGADAIQMVERFRPHVVLMDLNMPIMNGVQATRHIRERFPDVQVLALTTYATDEWVYDAIRAGAAGYLLKNTKRDALVTAIEGTAAGEAQLSPDVARKLMNYVTDTSVDSLKELSKREREILQLIAQGKTNPEIAARLNLATGTVRNYVSEIFAKLDVSDRAEAAALAVKLGFG
ncbi:response regulator transcription factor [Chloroflexi bacterium TSY]|nr:response regulator transcription factor [Chloroflexi bacterium TSY]